MKSKQADAGSTSSRVTKSRKGLNRVAPMLAGSVGWLLLGCSGSLGDGEDLALEPGTGMATGSAGGGAPEVNDATGAEPGTATGSVTGSNTATGAAGGRVPELSGSNTTTGTGAAGGSTSPVTEPPPETVIDPSCEATEVPFRVLTRLNRAEYDNTVRDLLGHTAHLPKTTLPQDSGDGGFDNNAAALNISPALVADYGRLATELAAEAVIPGSPGHTLIYTCQAADTSCATQIATDLATRAWRRPLEAEEAEALVQIYAVATSGGLTHDDGVQAMVNAVLLSPHFLFRPEIDPTPGSAAERALTGAELATRLSYFLWSSMPDPALSAAAANGDLGTTDGVQEQVLRMMADPKAEAGLFGRFAGLWFQTEDVSARGAPDPTLFPEFNEQLKADMETETRLFMAEFLKNDVSFIDYLDANFTYLNDRLAAHYGISGQFGAEFQRVTLDGTERGGLLTQAAVLTTSTIPTRSSPTFRGAYILARVLGFSPPPPPDDLDIGPLDDGGAVGAATQTVRQRLEQHRGDPVCAGCHNLMDPLGFGLENYDAIGRYRTTEASGSAIDTSGALINGEAFDGPRELFALLKQDPEVAHSVVTHLLTYALGRTTGTADDCLVEALTDAFVNQDGMRASKLISRVAASAPFRNRVGAPAP